MIWNFRLQVSLQLQKNEMSSAESFYIGFCGNNGIKSTTLFDSAGFSAIEQFIIGSHHQWWAVNVSLLIELHPWRWPTVTAAAAETRCSPHCAHIHCMFSFNTHQVSLNVSGCHLSCVPLLHLHFHVRLTPAAICHMATTRNGVLVRRFLLYSPTTICF